MGPLASGTAEVFIAGEPEARRKAGRLRDRIPVSAVVVEERHGVAQGLGLRDDIA